MLIPLDAHLGVLLKRVRQLPPLDPQLPAHRTLAIVDNVLRESLFRRSATGLGILRGSLAAGAALLRDCDSYLARAGAAATAAPVSGDAVDDFDGLVAQANELAGLLHARAQQIRGLRGNPDCDAAAISALLQRTAEWEMDFFDARQAVIDRSMAAGESNEDVPGLTPEKLQAFLRQARANDGLLVSSMRAISGGMGKTTWIAEIDENGATREVVIRQELPRQLNTGCAFAIVDEFQLLQVLFKAGVPVPEPLHLCSDPSLAATPYHVTPRVAGVAPGDFFGLREGLAREAVLDLAAALAKLHSLPIALFADYARSQGRDAVLGDTIRENYLKSIAQWRSAVEGFGIDRSPSIVFTLDWLETNVPDDERPLVLTHGDANLHNIMVADGRMSTLLDWELADFGGPEQDLAYIKPNIEKLIPWDDFIAHYRENGGPAVREDYFPFQLVFQLMRLYVGALNGQAMLADASHDDERLIEIDLNYVPLELRMILDVIRA